MLGKKQEKGIFSRILNRFYYSQQSNKLEKSTLKRKKSSLTQLLVFVVIGNLESTRQFIQRHGNRKTKLKRDSFREKKGFALIWLMII